MFNQNCRRVVGSARVVDHHHPKNDESIRRRADCVFRGANALGETHRERERVQIFGRLVRKFFFARECVQPKRCVHVHGSLRRLGISGGIRRISGGNEWRRSEIVHRQPLLGHGRAIVARFIRAIRSHGLRDCNRPKHREISRVWICHGAVARDGGQRDCCVERVGTVWETNESRRFFTAGRKTAERIQTEKKLGRGWEKGVLW